MITFQLAMKKTVYLLLTLAALVVSAAPAHSATPLKTPPSEQVWAFFEAIPDGDLPKGYATRTERESYHQDYKSQLADQKRAIEDEGDFYGSMVDDIDYQIYWSPVFLDPSWMEEVAEDLTDTNGPMPMLILSVYPGADPDRLFGLLEVREVRSGEGSVLLKTLCYWYSVSQKKATATTLPLDVPYTDEEITDDGLLYYNQNELYWVMRDCKFDWLEEPDRLIVMLHGIGATPVCYHWNGTEFVRDWSYSPLSLYGNGIGQISFGSSIPYGIHGYSAEWIDTEADNEHAWGYVKEGETDPRFIIYAYGYDHLTVDAIDVLYPNYKLFGNIHVGMLASEAIEAIKEFYAYDEEAPQPYVSEFDGKAWIFTGLDDPYRLGVDPEYFKDGKLTPDARIAVISIAPAVG